MQSNILSTLTGFLETSDFPTATRKTLSLADYYSLRDFIDTCPVEYQRPYDPSRENATEGSLVVYTLDLLFNRDVKTNMLPSLVIRQLTEKQLKKRELQGRKNNKVLELTDGQHRTVILFKIVSGEKAIPKDYVVHYKGRRLDIGGKTIPELVQMGGEYKEMIEHCVFSMLIHFDFYHNISDTRAAEIFAERNSGTEQSRQGKRNCLANSLCIFVRSLSRDIPEYNTKAHPLMSTTVDSKGRLAGNFFPGVLTSALNFDEDVARTLAFIIALDSFKKTEKISLDQNDLDLMYYEYGETLSVRYQTLLVETMNLQHSLLSRVNPKLRKDRMSKDKGFWNAFRMICAMYVYTAHTQNKSVSMSMQRNPGWAFWCKFNAFITKMCTVPPKLRKVMSETLFDRCLNKNNWFSKKSNTGIKVVYEELETFMRDNSLSDLGLVMKDNKTAFSAKTRAIKYTEQNGRDAITNKFVYYGDAVTDHLTAHANGGETVDENGQMVSSITNTLKSANNI